MSGLRGRVGLAACVASCVLFVGSALAEIRSQVDYVTYAVQGDSLAAVWGDIERRAPRALHNGLYAQAETRIRYRWDVRYVRIGEMCAATRPSVRLGVTIVLPDWLGKTDAHPALQAAWRHYARQVREHEETHHRIAAETAEELLAALRGAPRYPSCRALVRHLHRATHAVMERERRRQDHFDRISPSIRLR